MQVFELHFNPKGREDRFFDTFLYEPENIYEKRLGSLYMAGELTQALPQNAHFLNDLAAVIKKEYYSSGLKKSREISFRDAFKKANQFLDEESKRGNVSWLGNLNFATLNFKDLVLNFTKVGDIKILLQRGEELLDIGQNLEYQDTEPYPLKIFGSIVTGKLSQNDKIIILTKDAFSSLTQKEDFLNQLSKVSDEKGLKEILKTKKQILSEISGICLLLIVSEKLEPKKTITFRKKPPKFSFKKTFLKPISYLPLPKLKLKAPSLKPLAFRVPSLKLPSPKIPRIKLVIPKKKILLILILISILIAAFFIFRGEKEKELEESRLKIEEAQSKIIMAESFLILKDEEKALTLFQEALEILFPLTKVGVPLREEAISLQKTIEEHLK